MSLRRIIVAIGVIRVMVVMFGAFLDSVAVFSANFLEAEFLAASLLGGTNLLGTTMFGSIIAGGIFHFHNLCFILLFHFDCPCSCHKDGQNDNENLHDV